MVLELSPMGLLNELLHCREVLSGEHYDRAEIKKSIIQNNIYGVDIEKGAVDIARLRFWLSIVVDEETPSPLPNLDYKIMQGNSLIESFMGVDLSKLTYEKEHKKDKGEISLFDNEKNRLQKTVSQLLSSYYSCCDHNKKKKLQQDISDTISKQLETQAYDHAILENLKDINLAENNKFFLWHTWFSDVFNREDNKNGFDVVIGNPPYIQLQNNGGELANLYEDCRFKTFAKTGDIYCLFYERGWQLLRQQGHLCFITSNKWMRAGYGDKTRGFFAKHTNPKYLIDFAGVKIFNNATVDTNILIFGKEQNEYQTRCAVTDKLNKDSLKNLSGFVQQQSVECRFESSDSWVILSPIEQSIKRKIESVGTPLKDWDIQINYGIKTGFNDAFIISTEKRNEILDNCSSEEERAKTAELIRPILRGRDIKRYGYDWANLWLIYIPWHFPYQFDNSITGASEKAEKAFNEKYPAVYNHMLQYKESLANRNKAETGIRYEWYAMQRWGAKYWEDFNKPKIVWKRVGSILRFCYNNNGALGLDSTCFATGNNIEFICCVLNSPMGHYLLKDAPKTGTGDLLISVQAVEPIKVPIITKEQNSIFEEALKELIHYNSTEKEKEISHKVFDLYNLSHEEQKYIESNFT